MREYEVMLILPAEADEKVVSTATDRIAKVISTDGGEVGNIDRWGAAGSRSRSTIRTRATTWSPTSRPTRLRSPSSTGC